MAWAFDKTMNALGLTEGQDQTGQPSDTITSSQEAVGQGSGAGQSQESAQTQQQMQPSASVGARGKVMQKNVEKAKSPTNLGKIAQNVGMAKQNIQNEANAYVEAADDPYEQSTEQIRGNIQSYAKGQQRPDQMGWLTQYQSAPGMVEDLQFKTDTDIKDIDLLKNDAGIREMFRRGQDAEGTIGEAALDAALLRKNPEFMKQRDQALLSYQDLQKTKTQLEEESRGKAQQKREATAKTYKENVGKELQSAVQGLDQLAAQREAEFDAQLAAAEEARKASYMDQLQSYLNSMASSGAYDQYTSDKLTQALGAGSLYDPGALDPTQFYTAGKTGADTDVSQFYTGDEASQWNTLSALLGQGGTARAGGSLAEIKPEDYLGGGIDYNAFSQAALGYAAPRAIGAQENEARMEADKQFKTAAMLQDQQRAAQKKAEEAAKAERQKKLDAANIAQVNRNLQKKGGKK